ncbi:unnamed protein product [Brugia timori]|nr:Bm10777 [Brugia malayi]VDO17562.1 unnamed protein product [Brugia timori]
MADEEDIVDEAEESREDEDEDAEENEDAVDDKSEEDEVEQKIAAAPEVKKSAPPPVDIKSPTPGRQYGVPEVPKSLQRRAANYSGGKPSKHDKEKLMRSEGIIPIQAGSNKYASQRGMTG